jgi:hypothetical protein
VSWLWHANVWRCGELPEPLTWQGALAGAMVMLSWMGPLLLLLMLVVAVAAVVAVVAAMGPVVEASGSASNTARECALCWAGEEGAGGAATTTAAVCDAGPDDYACWRRDALCMAEREARLCFSLLHACAKRATPAATPQLRGRLRTQMHNAEPRAMATQSPAPSTQ